MSTLETILKKRDGGEHDVGELESLVFGSVAGRVPDYQLSAWLMAAYFQGLTPRETGALTDIMIRSGEIIDLSALPGPLVDKHSTGGVGDKVSLVLAPMVAACGVQVPMMSGRGLGHTGGTLDKLESIPGYSTALSPEQFAERIREVGYAMTGQSESVVPADRLMYALRDVTGTVESIPLITASILSKKFAEGASALVFDVKCGEGAFMKTLPQARELAESLVNSARALGRPVAACITRMDSPLGYKVGNILEVEESVECLEGNGPDDLMQVVYRLGAWMLVAGGIVSRVEDGEARCRAAIEDGSAMERFVDNVAAQGGFGGRSATDAHGDRERIAASLKPEQLVDLRSDHAGSITAEKDGVVTAINAYSIGSGSVALGAGRSRADQAVDPGAGVVLLVRPGDEVKAGDPLCRMYSRPDAARTRASELISHAFTISGHDEADSSGGSSGMILEELNAL